MQREFRLAGEGGQGLILAGIILAEAAIADGLNALQSQSYGPESRGGASKSEVIISDGEIDYPKVSRLEVLLAMTDEAARKYIPDVIPGGTVIIDSDHVSRPAEDNLAVYALPITAMAEQVTGRPIAANIVALGAIAALTGIVSPGNLESAVLNRVPRGTEEANRRALYAGLEAGRAVRRQGSRRDEGD